MQVLDLKDKVIWITGASSGIGASLAVQLNQMGARVIASARRKEKLSELKIKSAHPEKLMALPLDIIDPLSIEQAVNEVTKLERLDLVLHNAGIAQKGMVIENDMDIDRRIMETNYFGTVALTKKIMPIYMNQGYGWFGVVSSFAGVIGIPGRSAYSASKHALHGFFESLRAEEMDCKLKVSFIIPGFINSAITAKCLLGNGLEQGKIEISHRLGMTTCDCAKGIIEGLKRRKDRIIVGKIEVLLLKINRISPNLSRMIIKNHPMRKWRQFKSLFKVESTFFKISRIFQ